jgi:hypothetical protein
MPEYKFLITDGLSEAGLALLGQVGRPSNPKINADELVAALPDFAPSSCLAPG